MKIDDTRDIPDVRDGLTRLERAILLELDAFKRDYGDRFMSTQMLYGRVVERVNVSRAEFRRVLERLVGK